jgi:hypothetical protein
LPLIPPFGESGIFQELMHFFCLAHQAALARNTGKSRGM